MPRTEQYATIERDPNVDENHPDWTEGKEQASQIIQQKIENGEWPMSLTKLADECEWSRSHLKNTLSDLWIEKDESEPIERTDKQIKIPDGVDKMSYLEGYVQGLRNGG